MLPWLKGLEKSPTRLKELQPLTYAGFTGKLRDGPNSPKEAMGHSHRP